MEFIFLLPLLVVLICAFYFYVKSKTPPASSLLALSIALFPSIFLGVRSLGPFYGGADIGAGLILMGSSILLCPISALVFVLTKKWSLTKVGKFSFFIIGLYFLISMTNHFILVRQHKAYLERSVLDCIRLPIHCAIRDSKMEQIVILKNAGHNLEEVDGWGRTALFFAYYSHDKEEILQKLIELGANLQALDSSGYPLVHYFLFNNPKKFKLADDFIKNGFNINILYGSPKKMTLLNWAVVYKDNEVVNYLVSKGANPLVVDEYGYNACDRAKVYKFSSHSLNCE